MSRQTTSMGKEIQFILYNLPDGNGGVQAYIQGETLWLTQKPMTQLFDVEVNTQSTII